jgi:ubiquinol-cytochrome c reductase cytochrome c subunit
MRAPAATVAAAAALALPAGAGADPPPYGVVHPHVPPGTPLRELGKQLYAGNCASCHGSNGEGVLPSSSRKGSGDIRGAGPALKGAGALAADFYLRAGYMPLEHIGDQPTRSRVLFSDREIRAMVVYLASLGRGPPIPTPHPEHGRVSEGLKLFTDHCAGCHQVVAEGGYVSGAVAPPLHDATPTQIAQAVRIGPYVMPRFSKTAISERQLDSIVAYVEYAKDPHDPGGWPIGRIGPVPEGMVTWLIGGVFLVFLCVVIGERMRRA